MCRYDIKDAKQARFAMLLCVHTLLSRKCVAAAFFLYHFASAFTCLVGVPQDSRVERTCTVVLASEECVRLVVHAAS